MKRYSITFYLLLFAIILINESITLSHAWDCYTYADGLIDNNVTTVAVNREIVLCGTQLGGSQFDGAHWKNVLEGEVVRCFSRSYAATFDANFGRIFLTITVQPCQFQ